MDQEQITKYEYCKKYSLLITTWKKNLPFSVQQYGCGTSVPAIEHTLESIHREMHKKVHEAMKEANEKVQNIIDNI